ncbi:hypothetical protein ACHHYP_02950 [Achlya hypogyna]|uniref:Uncharacterized protein n=1 Tax=Achlya hypogyna TaxID=1202772 RepID=A0A1V9Z509_ACHHY|nr:hypothetical protein ACHHYP_02950 [Achlya hypogyna]
MADSSGSKDACGKPKRKVKVVASRYAQNLNLSNAARRQMPPPPASAQAAPARRPPPATVKPAPSAKATPASTPNNVAAPISTAATVHTTPAPPSPLASAAERLKAFRQKKATRELTRTPTKLKKARTDPSTNYDRKSAPTAVQAARATEPVATAPTVPATFPSSNAPPPPTSAASCPTKPTRSVPRDSDVESLELHESLYDQLCYAERLAAEAFAKQEADAMAQLASVFSAVHEKTMDLHRLERQLAQERKAHLLHTHLMDQARPPALLSLTAAQGNALAEMPGLLRIYGQQIAALGEAIAATLNRLPVVDDSCTPQALHAALDELTCTLEYTSATVLPQWAPVATLASHGSSLNTNTAQLRRIFHELAVQLRALGAASDHERSTRVEQVTQLLLG